MEKNNVGKVSPDACCGCQACIQVCNHRAITKALDKRGFEQISVDPKACVECGLCEKVCPILSKPLFNSDHIDNYACYALDNNIKTNGSSGGVFGLFASYVISMGGAVYGAAFDANLKLKTTRATSILELAPLYKSKYLLCDTNGQYKQIKKDLNDGLIVLYCATPCQISALKLYLRKDYENLILIEFVCHGVGSQTMFDDSIKYIERKKGINIKSFTFRKKYKSASSHYYSFDYEHKGTKGMETNLYLCFPYYNAYCKQLNCRPTCYSCQYAKEDRVADITIGDFHTIAKYDTSIDRFAGVSMVTSNNRRGSNFLNLFRDEMHITTYPWEVLRENNRFDGGSSTTALANAFMSTYETGDFNILVKQYLTPLKDWKRLLYYNLPKFVRRFVTRTL